jgi:hypothetical protein
MGIEYFWTGVGVLYRASSMLSRSAASIGGWASAKTVTGSGTSVPVASTGISAYLSKLIPVAYGSAQAQTGNTRTYLVNTIASFTKEFQFHPLVPLTNNMAVLPSTISRRSRSSTTTESTTTSSGLNSSSRSTPSTISSSGWSTIPNSRRNVSTSRLRSVGGGREASRGLLVSWSSTVSISIHVRRSGVGRSSSLSSHVRRDISGSLRVELDAAYLSAVYSIHPSCLIQGGTY